MQKIYKYIYLQQDQHFCPRVISVRNSVPLRLNQFSIQILEESSKILLIILKNQWKLHNIQIKIMKTPILFLILLVLASSSGSPLEFQFGNSLARFVRNQGIIPFYCVGGSGVYQFTFRNLPLGWSQNGNTIVVPNLSSVRGTYMIGIYVQDTSGNTLSGNINLNINGLAVSIQPATNNNQSGSGSFTGNLGLTPGGANFVPGAGGAGGAGTGPIPPTAIPITPTVSPQVSNLYSNEPGLPAGTNVIPNAGSNFPSRPTPSGNPSTPNVVPNIISRIQAPYVPERDSTPLTVDQVKRNAIFNRQITANKAIANLVAIIQQLTANVNAATNDIPLLEQDLQDKQAIYNECADQIFTITDTRTKIQNAIATRQASIDDANARIKGVSGTIDQITLILNDLIRQRTTAQNAQSPNAQKLRDLELSYSNCQSKLAEQEGQIQDLQTEISTIQTKIETTRIDVDNAPFEIARIDSQIPIVDSKIADLERQLAAARQEKLDLQNQKAGFNRLIQTGQNTIRNLETQSKTLENRLPALQTAASQTRANCNSILNELNAFRNELAQIQGTFQKLLTDIAAQENQLAGKRAEIQSIRASISNLPSELNLLTAELSRVNSNLNRQYYICNSAADNVRKAKQNLDALSMRLESESRWLAEANANLEKARAEKQLADIAVEEVLSVYTKTLPFSIVPNGQGLTDAGNPAGNNPSGSPLGPVPIRNEVNPNDQVVIGDINSYLSRAYGASVDPARPDTVSTIYPLSIVTLQALINKSRVGYVNPVSTYTPPAGNIYSFQCNAGASGVTGQGTVLSVQPGMIQVRNTQGQTMNLQVAGCTNLEANQRNHVLGLNDVVYYKGARANTSGNNINLYSLTCLA